MRLRRDASDVIGALSDGIVVRVPGTMELEQPVNNRAAEQVMSVGRPQFTIRRLIWSLLSYGHGDGDGGLFAISMVEI